VVSSISSIPKVGHKLIGKIEDNPKWESPHLSRVVTKNATVPTSIDCLISNIVYANPKRSRAIIIAINISLYSFIILKSPISLMEKHYILKFLILRRGTTKRWLRVKGSLVSS